MIARAVEQHARRLAELRAATLWNALLAAPTLVAAVAATTVVPALAIPLLVGGVVALARSIVAAVRRRDLIEALAVDPDAGAIEPVRRYAETLTSLPARRQLAESVRFLLADPAADRTVSLCRGDLCALADELDSPDWSVEPAAAAACRALLVEASASTLLDPVLAPELARSRVRQVLAGLHPAEKPHRPSARPPIPV